ncbi:hypothetical protein BN1110_06003 [bacterium YEK0313]|nr:hypothetical protein BN1110_06003 [bacterium YEK0313]
MRRLSLILTFLALAVIAAGVAPVRAQDEAARARPLVQRFATDNFNEIAGAVAALSGSGLAQAAPVIEALRDGRLVYRPADRSVYIRSAAGTWSVAATGEPAAAPEGTRPVRLNNTVRRAIDAAMGALGLSHPDPARRLAAAEAVFKSRDTGALAGLTAALAREGDPRVRRMMEEARAAILVTDPGAGDAERIAAIATVGRRGDAQALAVLGALGPERAAAGPPGRR